MIIMTIHLIDGRLTSKHFLYCGYLRINYNISITIFIKQQTLLFYWRNCQVYFLLVLHLSIDIIRASVYLILMSKVLSIQSNTFTVLFVLFSSNNFTYELNFHCQLQRMFIIYPLPTHSYLLRSAVNLILRFPEPLFRWQ